MPIMVFLGGKEGHQPERFIYFSNPFWFVCSMRDKIEGLELYVLDNY